MYLKFLSYCAWLWWHPKLWVCHLSLSDYTLSHSWSGFSTSDTHVKNKIPFIYISPVMCFPMFSCAHIKCQPTPCRDDQRLCDRCQGAGILTADSFGGIPMRETTIFFPVLVPRSFSKLSQYVSALCFILFLGRNHYWCVIPFHTRAPNSWPTCSHRYSSWQVSCVSSFASLYFSLSWNFSWNIFF